MAIANPASILYAQHGWADDHRKIARLARSLADPQTVVVTPSLGYFNTWIRMEPLVQTVEKIAIANARKYPEVPMHIIGHSMGGLIWIEVLTRHPEWWPWVESLILVASPVGGADLARAVDPLAWGVGIARDLGLNRRPQAEAIAAQIPTLVIAGDIDGGSDGTITIESTKVPGAEFLCLQGLDHAVMSNHPAVAEAIRRFWQTPGVVVQTCEVELADQLIRQLQQVKGMTDGHYRDFPRSKVSLQFENGLSIRTWKDPLGIYHVFVACDGTCLYSGFVGWLHYDHLNRMLRQIEQEHGAILH
jgi:pimeloyl-ACP methyl ester carboxylesterase